MRAVHSRRPDSGAGQVYSRTVVQRVLAEGVGIVAADQGEGRVQDVTPGSPADQAVTWSGRGGTPASSTRAAGLAPI